MDNDNTNEVVEAEVVKPVEEAKPVEQKPEPKPEAKKDDAAGDFVRSAKRRNKRKRSPLMSLLRLVIALIIIAVGVFGILYIVALAAKYPTIGAMLDSMWVELELMWQRIRN